MGFVIYADQSIGVDFSVTLGGGKRGMTEQFLNRPKVAAGAKKMSRETMAQRMRRRTRR